MAASPNHQDRLLELAKTLDVVPVTQLDSVSPPSPVAFPSSEDIDKVKIELGQRRSSLKRPLHGTFTAKEATTLLVALIDTECTAGQLKYLIGLGADVNFLQRKSESLIKRVRGKNREDVRSDVLRRVVAHQKHDLVKVLAPAADQIHKDNALGIAIGLQDLESIKILMACGADSNLWCRQIQNAIQLKHFEMVMVLIGADNTKCLSESSATMLLHQAVLSGELQVVQALLYCGADTNAASPPSVVTAVQAENIAVTAALCISQNPPVCEHLSRALVVACTGSNATNFQLVEILLAAGAAGEGLSRILVQATQKGQHQLVELLTRYASYDDDYAPEAARHAMSTNDSVMFNYLMRMSLEEDHANELLRFIMSIKSSVMESVRVAMVKTLMHLHPSARARGDLLVDACRSQETEMIEFLVHTKVPKKDLTTSLEVMILQGLRDGFNYKLLQLLVESGADVNHRQGSCLVAVVQGGDSRALEVLLTGATNAESLTAAFVTNAHIGWTEERYHLSEILVRAGVTGPCIDRSLLDVLGHSEVSRKLRQLFLDHGKADINYQEGESLVIAVRQQDIQLLQQLLEYRPASSSLHRALTLAVRIADSKIRRDMCSTLLRKCQLRNQKMLEQVLYDVVRLHKTDTPLVALLLQSGASIDHGDGRTLLLAIDRGDAALLDQLVKSPTGSQTLSKSLAYILHSTKSNAGKLSLCQTIFSSRTKLDDAELGLLLPDTILGDLDVTLLQLFLEKGASVNLEPPTAMMKAIDLSNKRALELIMGTEVESAIVDTAFDYAWKAKCNDVEFLKSITRYSKHQAIGADQKLREVLEARSSDISLVKYLLEIGACASPHLHQCIVTAALRTDKAVFELLLGHVESRQTVNMIFEQTLSNEEMWTDPTRVSIVQTLLEHGAFGEIVDETMLLCVDWYNTHANAHAIMDHLIAFEGSADFKNGIGLQDAAQRGDRDLIKKLLTSKISAATVNTAFPHILLTDKPAKHVLATIEDFFAHIGGVIDLTKAQLNGEPLVFLAIRRFPHDADVLGSLLHHGALVDQTTGRILDQRFAFEAVTPLVYILSGLAGDVHDKHVEMLIEAGANVNFTTLSSKFHPLIGAVKQNRTTIAASLLARGACPSNSDYTQRTPLCYASMRGNLVVMRDLIKAEAPTDDGSLHDAILNTEYAAAKLLLENGHQANIPSVLHDNKNPLILLVQNESRSGPPAIHIEMLRVLVARGAKTNYRFGGKSLIILALDCKSATSIVPILLAAFAGREINEDYNLWRNDGLVYSPLSYVTQNQQQSDACHKTELLVAMAPYNCAAVYYHEFGPQPHGFTGAPAEVMQQEQRRQARLLLAAELEEDHQNSMRRQRELELQQTSQLQRQHELRLALERESNRAQLQQQSEASRQLEQFEERRRKAQLAQTREENVLQLEFKTKLALQDQATLNAQMKMQKQLLEIEGQNRSDEEAARERMHQRNLREMKAMSTAASAQQKLLESRESMMSYPLNSQQRMLQLPSMMSSQQRMSQMAPVVNNQQKLLGFARIEEVE